ncbi:MAG TPA: CHAT domain-containing protein [Syntrophobacteria bacterium]|nr:CHAT domain-containing protein [Syntrophobacteria bacterium]
MPRKPPKAGGASSGRGARPGCCPSLADEFFRLGVRNHVGTAWEVNDVGAVEFAKAFSETVLAPDRAKPTVGEAVRVGRRALYARSRSFG